MKESLALAEHLVGLTFDRLPEKAVHAAKRCFLDALGVTLAAGSLGEGCRAFIDLTIAAGGRQESTVIGFGAKAPAHMAAFANGAMAHSMDFEDAHEGAFVHPNTATIPAALAIAEALGGVTGKEFITATAAGCDLVCRLGLACHPPDLQKYGWYPPPIFSTFGGAAAAGKLLGLDAGQMLDAFSLALCQATCSAELTNSPNSVVRSIRDAFSAKAGVLSALLAKKGVTGFPAPFEGKAGFFQMYARGDCDLARLTDGLGQTFEGANLSFKPWPSCRGTHSFIQAALEIREKHAVEPDSIESISITASPFAMMLCEPVEQKRQPVTAIDAKFSIPFTVATALVRGRVTLDQFSPDALSDSTILGEAKKVSYEIDPKMKESSGVVQVASREGVFSARVDLAYGNPGNPLSDEKLIEKFVDCARHSAKPLPVAAVKELARAAMHLEEMKDMRDVARYL